MLDLANLTSVYRETSSAHPEIPEYLPHYGFSDTGGAAFQSEPMQQFMKYSLYSWQSPYWDPYVAAGTIGPETLVDNKFSPSTLLIALLGGSSLAFHFVLLFLYTIALYFVIRLVTVCFRLSFLSGVLAAIVYFLGGYAVATLSSNVSQVYLYVPILLFSLCNFVCKPNFWRFLIMVLANVLVFLTTFLPTTFLTMLVVYLISAAFVFNSQPVWKKCLILIGLQIVSAVLAFFLLAFLWLPIFEGAKLLGLFEMYNARIFYPAATRSFLSIFSSKNFWESYNAIPVNVLTYIGNVIFHFGLVAALIISQIFTQRKNFRNWIVVILLIVLVLFLGRIFAIPGLSQFFGMLPQIKNVGEQYLWFVVAVSIVVLSAYGMESLAPRKKINPPLTIAYLLILASIFYLVIDFVPKADYYFVNFGSSKFYLVTYFYLGILFALLIASAIIFYLIAVKPKKILLFKSLLVLLVFLEMFFYMNTLRVKRIDLFSHPPAYVAFLKNNIGHHRLASYAWSFMPDLGAAYQIQQLESLNYVLPWYKNFYKRTFQTKNDRWGDFAIVRTQNDPPNINETILDMMSVKYILVDSDRDKYINYFKSRNYPIVYDDGWRIIFENTDAYPRVLAIANIIEEPLTPDTQGYSPREVVFSQDEKLLEEAKKVGIQVEEAFDLNNVDQATLISYENSKIVIEAKLASPAIITLMDNWHPNWRAFANSREVYIGKVNESFRGMALPAGDYRLELTYQPKTLKLGLILAGLTAMGLLILFFFRRRFDKFLSKITHQNQVQPSRFNRTVSFCVVVPAYNEEKNIQNCVQIIFKFLKKLKNKTCLIVVNDGSTDQTLKKLRRLQKKSKDLEIVNHPRNRGYGAANISGGRASLKMGYDYVLFMDADLTQNVTYLHTFVREMEKGTDFIKATRYREGGGTRGVPLGRRLVSRIGNLLAKIVFRLPLSDYTNGFRALKTKFFAKIRCQEKGFSYLIEEVYYVSKQAKTYAEVPYTLTARSDRFSQSKFNYSLKVYFNYLKYLFKR